MTPEIRSVLDRLAARRDAKIAEAEREYERTVEAIEEAMATEPRAWAPSNIDRVREWLERAPVEFTTSDVGRDLPDLTPLQRSQSLFRLMATGKIERIRKGHGRSGVGVYRVVSQNGRSASNGAREELTQTA